MCGVCPQYIVGTRPVACVHPSRIGHDRPVIMARTYRNPVHPGYFADPFVVSTPDGYVAVGTGTVVGDRAFEVLRSPDLVHWEHVGGPRRARGVGPAGGRPARTPTPPRRPR